MSAALHAFRGGLRLDWKRTPCAAPITRPPLPERLFIPVNQHVGMPLEICVSAGARVLKGQAIARSGSYVSAALHAPTSGTILRIDDPEPARAGGQMIVMVPDGADRWLPMTAPVDPFQLPPETLCERLRDAGIVGLGGAGFPAHVKMREGVGAVQTLILNGVECEPWVSCDGSLLCHRAGEVLSGARIIRHVTGAARVQLAIAEDMDEAWFSLVEADPGDIELVRVPQRYPAGGEKQLIRTLTGIDVAAGRLPVDYGIILHNVATAAAVHRALVVGEPLIARIVTVGGAVHSPANVDALIGTPIDHLLAFCGGPAVPDPVLILGGPMMGVRLANTSTPVTKTSHSVHVMAASDEPEQFPCIRCGECVEVCPAGLRPYALHELGRAGDLDACLEERVFDCIECGCCAYVCPSAIPLVDGFRATKEALNERDRTRAAAGYWRSRYLAHNERARAAAGSDPRDDMLADVPEDRSARQAAVAAALERARSRRRSGRGVNDPDGSHDGKP